MIMCVLCSQQVVIFSACSHLWKPQYARFSAITFIVITGILLHLMPAITRAHTSTHTSGLMHVKNSMHHFCL